MSRTEPQSSVPSPYRGIEPFRYVDRENFFGRSGAIEELFAKVLLYRLVVLFGESGAGKSSLLNAGLIPTVQKERLRPERLRVRPDPEASISVERIPTTQRRDRDFLPSMFSDVGADHPSSPTIGCSIGGFLPKVRAKAAECRPLLIFDQFEELFTLFEQKQAGGRELQLKILDTLFQIVNDQELQAKVVIVIREDFLGKLEILARSYPQVLDHRVRLRYLTQEDALEAIVGPFKPGNALPSRLMKDLADKIVEDLSRDTPDGLVAPTQVQIICARLWETYSNKRPEIGVPEYNALDGATGIVKGFFESELQQIEQSLRPVAITILGNLITACGTRDVVSEEKVRSLANQYELKPDEVSSALGTLGARRLINRTSQRGTYFYEVSSEYLIRPIQKESQQLAAERAEKKAAAEAAEREREASRVRELERATALAEEQKRRAEAERLRAEEQAQVAATQRELARVQQQRAETEARQAKRFRRLSLVLGGVLLVAIVAIGVAVWQSRLAEQRLRQALMAEAAARQSAEIALQQSAQAQSARVTGTAVLSVAWSPDGKRLATGSQDTTAKVWDAASGRDVLTLRGQHDSISSVAWSPDAKQLATGSGDGTARVWDAETGEDLLRLSGHDASVFSVAWSPDMRRLATASQDGTTKVWDAEAGKQLLTLRGHTGPVYSVAWSPDERRLATASLDHTAKVWDAVTGQELLTLMGHNGPVLSVAWSTDGRRLATASQDKTTKVWDAATGKELVTLRGDEDSVMSVAWSPDGKRLATGSQDTTAKVWDAETSKELLTLRGHSGPVLSVAWSPDGKRLATASQDRTTQVWDAETGKLLLTLTVP